MTDPPAGPPTPQLELVRTRVSQARVPAAAGPAPERPIARVAVDVGLAHLDRPFDYTVPADLHEQAEPGCRVSVRFAGKQVGGFLLERLDASEHAGTLQRLRRVVSPEPVLTPQVARLCRAVADHYAGTLSDVLRLAVPPRHARVEREPSPPLADPTVVHPHGAQRSDQRFGGALAGPWTEVEGGQALLSRLAAGDSPRASWTALPGHDVAAALAAAAAATLDGGRGSLLCVPDHRDAARLDAALAATLGAGRHVVLTADLGPAARYRAFLAVLRGRVQVVVGTRAAAFAPVRDLGLVACWDDGDDLHAEQRAPYPHVREVLVQRAHLAGAAAVLAGHARTPEVQLLVDSGWLAPLTSTRERVRARWPLVHATGSDGAGSDVAGAARDPAARAARLPHQAFAAVRDGLSRGPVLLQVPRAGYRAALACQSCRTPATCPHCSGPLRQPGRGRPPVCAWCARTYDDWACPACGSQRLRAPVVGAERTAEELGRAFPGVPVRRSAGDRVLAGVPAEPALVVATPGAEPPVSGGPGGYAAAVLLDTGLLLARPDLRTGEECLRRWLAVAALVRPAGGGGRLLVVGDATPAPVQALVRADPEGFAARELAERVTARLPPAVRLAIVEGTPEAVAEVAEQQAWPEPVEVLGPVPLGPDLARLVVRVPRTRGSALARALAAVQATRSARKQQSVRVRLDPAALG